MSFLRFSFLLAFCLLLVAVAVPHGRTLHPAADSVGHFWVHLTVLLALFSLLAIFAGMRRFGIAGFATAVAALLAMAPVLGSWPGPAEAHGPEPRLRLLQFNTLYANRSPESVVRMIRVSGADAVTLQEVTPSMRAAVETLRDIYPRQLHCRNAIRIGGVSVLSKVDGPKGRCAETRLLAASLPVRFAGHDLAVTSLHLKWPWPHAQNEQVARLATFFPANGLPVVMAGDLNAAPWSATAARLARMSGTTVATGYRPSWLATELPEVLRPWIGLPIDHAFAPQDMRLVSARVLGDAGSDHLPVLFEFSPKDR